MTNNKLNMIGEWIFWIVISVLSSYVFIKAALYE